jgi:very-short-patch-repair endonuclease
MATEHRQVVVDCHLSASSRNVTGATAPFVGLEHGGVMDHVDAADRAIARAAARQHGVFTRAFALRAGLSPTLIDRRLKVARYWMLWPGVYTFPEVPSSWEQVAMAGVLYADPVACLSGPASARKLQLPGFDNAGIEISTTRRLRADGTAIRSRTSLQPGEIVHRDGIPITIPERTLLDLSTALPEKRLEGLIDAACHLGLTESDKFVAYLQQPDLPRRRRSLLLRLLAERGDVAPAASELETGLARLLRHPSMPSAVRQYEIRLGGRFIARPDFAYPEAKLGVEGHSFLHHGSKLQWERDMQRHALTESVGWYLVYVTWWDVEYRADETRTRIRRIYNERLAMLSRTERAANP